MSDLQQNTACRSLWAATIHAHLDTACGVLFSYPKRGTAEAAAAPGIDMQYQERVNQYRAAEKFIGVPSCKWHEEEKEVRLKRSEIKCPKARCKIKNSQKRCEKCGGCAESKLYPYKKRPTTPEVRSSRVWMETSHMDEAFSEVGLGGVTVNKAFDVVQRAITLEKKLHEEFSYQHKMRTERAKKKKASKDKEVAC